MKTYQAKGIFTKKGEKHAFTKNVEAQNEKMAKEQVYSLMGGKQNLKRRNIAIESIKAAN